MTLKGFFVCSWLGMLGGDALYAWGSGYETATWVAEVSLDRAFGFVLVWAYVWYNRRATGYVKL